jgi:cell division septum initiation protein DivIVA
MLRQNSVRSELESAESNQQDNASLEQMGNIDIQRELNQLEEFVLESPRVPLTRWTLIDEETLLDQLDLVRVNLPVAFAQALEILQQKEEILLQAEDYGEEIIRSAQKRAAQILDEMGLVRQAEREANQIRQQVQRECEELQEQTLREIERMRQAAQQELEQLRQLTLAECEDIQNGADDYADAVLNRIEEQLTNMLRIVHNGRQQLQVEPPPNNQ